MSTSHTTGSLPGDQTEGGRPLSAVLADNWWAVAVRGVAAMTFGLLAFNLPVATILSVLTLFAAFAVVNGIFGIISAVYAARQSERWVPLLLEGLVSIAGGVIMVMWPGITVDAFVVLIATWALITGVLTMVAAVRLEADHGKWWLFLSGAVSVVFGVVLALAPFLGAVVMTWWVGAYAFVFGAFELFLALKLRAHRRAMA